MRKTNRELVSVTQRDEQPLEVGLRVLVIAGVQARIVADYTLPGEAALTSLPAEVASEPLAPPPGQAAAPAPGAMADPAAPPTADPAVPPPAPQASAAPPPGEMPPLHP